MLWDSAMSQMIDLHNSSARASIELHPPWLRLIGHCWVSAASVPIIANPRIRRGNPRFPSRRLVGSRLYQTKGA